MAETLAREVLDAIDRQLPSQVGSLLRTRLEAAEKDAAEVARLRIVVLDLDAEVQRRRKDESSIKSREEAVAGREASLRQRELQADVVALKLQHADDKVAFARGLVEIVFRSPSFYRNVAGTMPVAPGGGQYPSGQPFGFSETVNQG